MTCGSCVARVKNELFKLGDITAADVQLQSPQSTISMSKHIPTAVLQQAISKAGNYQISESLVHTAHVVHATPEPVEEKASYLPVFLIFGYITGTTVLFQVIKGGFDWMEWMNHFMAGFFLVFSFFKLLNLKGFAESYAMYDIVAKRWSGWGYVYAFIELALGLAFLGGFNPLVTNLVTLVVMTVSIIGVLQTVLSRKKIRCACLGEVFNLPMSTITVIEDGLMIVMSGVMLLTLNL